LATASRPSDAAWAGVQVLAPRDHVHPERLGDRGDLRAEPPQSDHAERRPRELRPDRVLPAALAQRAILGDDVPRQREDQRPRQLDRRGDEAVGAGHDDAQLARRLQVDRRVHAARRDQQPQLRQPLQPRSRERRPLPHRHDDVEAREPLDHRVVASDVIVEHRHLDGVAERLPRRAGERHALVVVEDRHARLHGA